MDQRARSVLGVGLLAALLVGFAAGMTLGGSPAPASHEVVVHAVVLDQGNGTLFDGNLTLGGSRGNATALGALESAALAGNFTYSVTQYPSMGAYVTAVNGTQAAGNDGWVFRTLSGGSWCWASQAPDRTPLSQGETVAWLWGSYATGCYAAS